MSELPDAVEDIRQMLAAGENLGAIEHSLVERGVSVADAHRLLALAFLKEGSLDAAIGALKRARAAGTNSAAETAFGRFLNRERYKEAALNCFLAAIELDPQNEDALALVCMHYADIGDTALAVRYGQKSLEARDRQSDSAAR